MQLSLPDILRFKGRNAAAHCDEWERELRGRCKREGNTLTLSETVKVRVEGSNVLTMAGQRTNGAAFAI